jgi:hypothetical protein
VGQLAGKDTCDRGERSVIHVILLFFCFLDEEIYSYVALIGLQSNNGVNVVLASDLDLPCEPESCHCHD